ncbi:MAG: hypothetical protein Q9219_000523 [cf. Caloplaca sp. 3 TL-2023]
MSSEVNGGEAATSPTKRQKVAHRSDPHRRPTTPRIFAPFRTIGLVSPTSVPFTSLPLGKTTFQITTSVGRCLHTYDLRRGLNLVFISRPQTPAPITATVAWKDRVLAAWGGEDADNADGAIGVWVFQRGKQSGQLEMPMGLKESIKELVVFGSWIVGRGSTRLEIWKSGTYGHYTTIMPQVSHGTAAGNTLSGGICNMPTFLNKILVGKRDGSVDIWNVSTGKLVYTILPPNLVSGAVTSLEPAPALSLVAIARADGSLTIHDIRTDTALVKLNARNAHGSQISSISFRTDGRGAGEDGQKAGIMATAESNNGDVTFWDLNGGGRVAGILHGAHNPPSSAHSGISGGISKIEFLSGQDVIITGGMDNALKSWIFDANSLSAVPRILHSRSGHAAPLTKLIFMPTNSEGADSTGKWILSAGRDRSLWGWSVRKDGQSSELSQGPVRKKAKKLGLLGKDPEMDNSMNLEDLKAPEITSFACSLNRDGGMGAAPSAGGIWKNVATKKGTTDTADNGLTGWESVVTGHRGDKYARTWFWGRKRAGRWAFETADGTEVTSVAVSPCGTFALVGSAGGSISMFNLQSGILRQRFPAPLNPSQAKKMKVQPQTTESSPHPLRFGPGEGKHRKAIMGLMVDSLNRTVISCGLDGKIKFWDFHTGRLQDEIDWSSTTAITAAQYYRSSDLVALSCDDLSIRIIDTETKKLVRELWGCLGQISDFCFSNDGRWIIAASTDSTIRVWDLPTSHMINAFRVESPCTALTFSDTGEYLATAHTEGVGINLWNNRTLFTYVPTRMIRDDEIFEATLPTTSGEGGQGLLEASFEEREEQHVEGEEKDLLANATPSAIDGISEDLVTLSLVPKAKWQTLLHLQTIKARNKPTEPPKAPEKAPFFLPSLANGDQATQNQPSTLNGTSAASKQPSQLNGAAQASRISRPSLSSTTRSQFTILLHAFSDTSSPEDADPLLTHLSGLPPSAADTEIRSLANMEEMTTFIQALTVRLRQKRDYELVQVWMSVFLKCHAGEVVRKDGEDEGDGGGKEELRVALREWREEQRKEGKRLGELIGYCSGVLGWLRREADPYCARAAQNEPTTILTSDSDLLVYDTGPHTSIIFFNQIFSTNDEPPSLKANIFHPAKIATRFHLPNFQRLAYEIKTDPTATFAQVLLRAKEQLVADNPAYRSFLEEYDLKTLTPPPPPLSTTTSFLDPRLSELIHQLASPTPETFISISLPFLNDDPTRASAWEPSLSIRAHAYGFLVTHLPPENPTLSITETTRKGARIVSTPVSVSLVPPPPPPPPIQPHHTTSTNADRLPPPPRTGEMKTEWSRIHLRAQARGILYSYRMLAQTRAYLHRLGVCDVAPACGEISVSGIETMSDLEAERVVGWWTTTLTASGNEINSKDEKEGGDNDGFEMPRGKKRRKGKAKNSASGKSSSKNMYEVLEEEEGG